MSPCNIVSYCTFSPLSTNTGQKIRKIGRNTRGEQANQSILYLSSFGRKDQSGAKHPREAGCRVFSFLSGPTVPSTPPVEQINNKRGSGMALLPLSCVCIIWGLSVSSARPPSEIRGQSYASCSQTVEHLTTSTLCRRYPTKTFSLRHTMSQSTNNTHRLHRTVGPTVETPGRMSYYPQNFQHKDDGTYVVAELSAAAHPPAECFALLTHGTLLAPTELRIDLRNRYPHKRLTLGDGTADGLTIIPNFPSRGQLTVEGKLTVSEGYAHG